tara:strand:- start:491 stop:844 length:354 start_codon:yes stop_codon:yes gene_type:complete
MSTKNLTTIQQESLTSQGWEFDINSNRKWAKNSITNDYLHGDFVVDYLIEEASEILWSKKHEDNLPIKVKTLQEQLDKFKLKLLKTNPVIIQHEDGSLSQGQGGEWLLQHILKLEHW